MKITTNKAGQVLAQMIACLSDTDKEMFRVSLLKTVFHQAVQFCSCGIANFMFSCEFHVAIPQLNQSKIFDKTIEGVNIIQFGSISVSIGSMYVFYLF